MMMLNRFCDLCGTSMPCSEYVYKITDSRDRYCKYHSRHWNVCDVCHDELMDRRKEVLENIKDSIDSDNGCQGMIEFD